MTRLFLMAIALLAAGAVQAAVCDGIFNMNSNGYSGFLSISNIGETMNRETFQGNISMAGGPAYLVNGVCDNSANGGRIQFNVTFPSGAYVSYSGSYFFGATATNMSGRFFDGRQHYSWSAYQTYGSGGGGFVSDCAGDYDINSNGTLGLLHLELDASGGLVGNIRFGSQPAQSVNGICQMLPNGRIYISFTRYSGRVSQEYKGHINVSAAGFHMSGHFIANGRSFPWHANRY